MRHIGLISALLALLAAPAFAGGWPRGKGMTFASGTALLTWPKGRPMEYPDIYGGLLIEHGLTERLSFGLDAGTPDAKRPDRLKAIAYLRYSLSAPDARHQLSVDLGVGRYLGQPALRMGAAYGTGFALGKRNGWVSLEGHALRQLQSHDTALSLNATFGITVGTSKIIAQLSGFQALNGTQTASFTPSYVKQIGKGRFLEIGATLGLKGKPDPALKVGIWQEF